MKKAIMWSWIHEILGRSYILNSLIIVHSRYDINIFLYHEDILCKGQGNIRSVSPTSPLIRWWTVSNHVLLLGHKRIHQGSGLIRNMLLHEVLMNVIHMGELMGEMAFPNNLPRKIIFLLILFGATLNIIFCL